MGCARGMLPQKGNFEIDELITNLFNIKNLNNLRLVLFWSSLDCFSDFYF